MDPIVSKLGQAALSKVNQASSFNPAAPQTGMPKPEFTSNFDKTLAEKLLDRMQDGGGNAKTDMTVLSADDINIKTDTEFNSKSMGGDDKLFSSFKQMNKDLTSLDAAIETLTTPGLKVSPKQLLALQAGIANTSLMAEGFSKVTDAVARGIQTIVQTQIG